MAKFSLERRTILRGLVGGSAVALGLPLLEAMLDDHGEAHADGSAPIKRFVSWFFGNGVYLPNFEPASTGATWELSPALEPLEPVKDYVNVCTGLWNRSRRTLAHHDGMCVFSGYSVEPFFGGSLPYNSHMGGPTVDQLIADAIGDVTPLRALHVGCDRLPSVVDGGTTLAALSHAGPNQPHSPIHSPAEVWQQLFGTPPPDDRHLRRSILDAVQGDLGRLQRRLGSRDRKILDAHMDGVRDLERKVQALTLCEVPDEVLEENPAVPDQDLTLVGDLMDDLITVAFKCDITRVATHLFHYGAGQFRFHMIGQAGYEHHTDNTHQGGDANGRYTAVVRYCMERLAHLAENLREEVDPAGGNLLDSTIIYCSTDCSHGWSHSLRRQPILLVGHAHDSLEFPGIHYQAVPYGGSGSQPDAAGNTSDVLLTVLQAYDPSATQVGDMSTTGGDVAHSEPAGSTTPLESIRGSAWS